MTPYRNPVYPGYFADPFVLRVDAGYVAYGTGRRVGARVFEVLRSPDLVHWSSVGGALDPVAADLGGDYWAPEVVAADGQFFMYYSVGHDDTGHHLRVAVAENPAGPFTDQGVVLTPDEPFAIDPHPFRDVDGSWWLFFAHDVLTGDRVGTTLAVARLPGLTGPLEEVQTIARASADWQLFARQRSIYGQVYDWHTLEGPSVVRRGGRYYCFYSGGAWTSDSYGVSYLVADAPSGPWESDVEGPAVLRTVPTRVVGPGHNSVTQTPTGDDVIVYHAWDPELSARRMCIDPIVWTPDGPRCDGPSWERRDLR